MLSFFNNSVGNIGGGGFEPNIFLDASILEQLRSEGYIFEPTSFSAEYVIGGFQRINKTVLGTKTIPAFQDGSGNIYVVDERKTVYLISISKIDQSTGLPTNTRSGTPTTNVPNTTSNPSYKTGGPIYTEPLPFNPNVTLPPPPSPPPVPIPPVTGIPSTPPPVPPGGTIGSGKIYSQFNIDDIIPNQQEIITRALWSGNDGNLKTFFTSSVQSQTSKRYYYEIYNASSSYECVNQPQFSVAYGHKQGSGSADEGGQIQDTPSRAIYGQYKQLCLNPAKEYFTIGGQTTEHIYSIIVNRARMREYLDEGNIELCLAYLSGSQFISGGGLASAHTGSNVKLDGSGKVLRLVDDSKINSAVIENGGEVYQMVSGSIEDGIYNSASPHIYGLMYRRLGIIVLDANKLDASASFATVTDREIDGDNSYKLFTSISGAAKYLDGSGDYLGFQGRSAEKVKSTHYFCRVKNAEYNFSNNPSFVTGSEGDLYHPLMINNPITYITTVGLYNPRKELVAVAKLSKPILKSFVAEALIKVKLDF
jgi:hypothetical protein